jgi:hypothetical protein
MSWFNFASYLKRGITMKELKPHPRLSMLHERFGGQASAITLSGFVGPSSTGIVRLFPTPSVSDCIEVPETAILHFEQDDISGLTELFVDPSVIVTVVSTRKVPLVALALRQQDDRPDGGDNGGGSVKSCLEKRIEKCKSDPTVHDKTFCDSEKGKHVFQLLCDLFGEPSLSGLGSGSVIV